MDDTKHDRPTGMMLVVVDETLNWDVVGTGYTQRTIRMQSIAAANGRESWFIKELGCGCGCGVCGVDYLDLYHPYLYTRNSRLNSHHFILTQHGTHGFLPLSSINTG